MPRSFRRRGIASLCRGDGKAYSIRVKPSVFGRVGIVLPATVIDRPVEVSVPVNERPPVGGGPSPMSSEAVPVSVVVPPTTVAPVIQASTLMIW